MLTVLTRRVIATAAGVRALALAIALALALALAHANPCTSGTSRTSAPAVGSGGRLRPGTRNGRGEEG
ncbi:hypothetical protein, partial [Streptomyces sp. NPDC004579]|uniref:hypothetical protein n=1 Tax=Streptomyces sp. NPDC004579 TaxID=3154667 RepID=UPI0033A8EF01